MTHPFGVRTCLVLLVGALGVATLLTAPDASAQPAPALPTVTPRPQPATEASTGVPAPPPPIEIHDPLLAPMPPAAHVLAGWRDALALVASRSVELTVALQEIERSEGLTRQALGAALTTVTASGTIKHDFIRQDVTAVDYAASVKAGSVVSSTSTVPPVAQAIATLTASQPIFAPRAWHAIGTARRSVEVTRLSADNVRRTIITAVANAIVGVVTAERVAEINRVGLKNALERLELSRRKTRLGSGTRLDVVRAEQDATLARAQIVTGDESLRQAREALGLALGTNDAYGVTPSISLDGVEQALREECQVGTAETRPDVLAAKAAVEVSERVVKEAKLGFSPTALVSSTLTYSSDSLANARNYAWSIQGVLSIPIWDGGSRYGEIRAAKASSLEQMARLDGARRQANLDAIQALRAMDVAQQTRAQSEAARDLARESARLTQLAYESGAATSFELIDAGRRQREAELDLALKEFSVVKARMAALLATATCSM